jgi:hypothetical protein
VHPLLLTVHWLLLLALLQLQQQPSQLAAARHTPHSAGCRLLLKLQLLLPPRQRHATPTAAAAALGPLALGCWQHLQQLLWLLRCCRLLLT